MKFESGRQHKSGRVEATVREFASTRIPVRRPRGDDTRERVEFGEGQCTRRSHTAQREVEIDFAIWLLQI